MLERILQFSVTHRGLVVMLTLALAVVGIQALSTLPIDAVPDITNKQVQINTSAPALSTVEMEKQVTFPIETALMGIPGLEYTRSLSRNAFSQITAVFEEDVDIYFARQQVGERLQAVRDELPAGAEPSMGAIATGLGEVYMWTIAFEHPDGKGATPVTGGPGWQVDGTYRTPEGDVLRTNVERSAYLRTIQDWVVRPQLRGVPGLADIDSIGGYEKQYHVEADPDRMVAYGFTFSDIAAALEANNASTGAGYVERNGEALIVRATGRIEPPFQLEQLAAIVVGSHDGTPIHIGDVAKVVIGRELRTGSASANGVEAVVGTAVMRTGENSRVVAQGVHDRLPDIAKNLPPDIAITPMLNRMKLVDATVSTVRTNLIEGALLVIIVLFLVLGNFRAALITGLAIPLAMLFTAIGMNRMGISGNLMSLGAIDFGIIVDGAVIIVENCMRRLGERQHALGRRLTLRERVATTFAASKQVRSATAFGETIIIVVYLPILTLAGVEGKMFHPMAWTVIFALSAAFVLSLTFVPAMVALCITGDVKETENFAVRWAKRLYVPTVEYALRFRWAITGTATALFVGSLVLFFSLGAVFVPRLDEQDFAIHAMRIPSISITQSTKMQLQVETALAALPEVQVVFSKTGTAEMATDPMPPNVSDTFVIMKPSAEWPDPELSRPALRRKMAKALDVLPGNKFEYTQPIEMRFNELIAGVRSDVAVMVYGDDFAAMERAASQVAATLRQVSGSADVKVEQTKGLATLTIAPKRDVLARFGLNVTDIHDVVGAAVGGREAGQVFEGDRRFDVFVRLPERYRADLSALRRLRIPLPEDFDGDTDHATGISMAPAARGGVPSVPLELVADLAIAEGPNQISRQNGKRRVIVQSNVRGRDIASFVKEAKRLIDEQVQLPPGGWLEWGGQFKNLQAAQARLTLVVPACLLMILFLLYSTFGSIKYAIMVFTGVPLALSGGIAALWMRDIPFSISAAVGFIALSGVAVLNGLVMVTFINQLRQEGQGIRAAITEGAVVRLRPVLMTALVAALGFLPMALASGTGAEVQRPLATVVIGGIVTSTLLTLVVLPALYLIVSRDGDLRPETVPAELDVDEASAAPETASQD